MWPHNMAVIDLTCRQKGDAPEAGVKIASPDQRKGIVILMSHFIVRHADSARLVYTTTFATRDDAEQAAQFVIKDGSFTIETLEEYGESAQKHLLQFKAEEARCTFLEEVITDFLREGVDGSTDVDEFIAEHEELAEAIGYEFETETTFVISAEVVVKHKPGKTDLEDALDIQVKQLYGYGDAGIIDIDITDIHITEQ